MSRYLIIFMSFVMIFASCSNQDVADKKESSPRKEIKATPQDSQEKTNSVSSQTPQKPVNPTNRPTKPTLDDVGDPNEVAVIETEQGEIVLEFFADKAPMHVANFKKLAKSGFYDGTKFHRVLPGFVIQGGDPNTKDSNPNNDGMGGPGYSIDAEFNSIQHELGILSMARSADPNSGGSQFFICLGRAKHLDNEYTVFGKVIKGIEVVKKIGSVRRNPANKHDRSLPAVTMRSVRIVDRKNI